VPDLELQLQEQVRVLGVAFRGEHVAPRDLAHPATFDPLSIVVEEQGEMLPASAYESAIDTTAESSLGTGDLSFQDDPPN